ncbi:hypothetical protein GCM10012278_58560 [Nonomuraea glycinis]|uniref:Uncharacterized protein n=1 Tax=Nonomuraea glycinis TaxID=2047744 RepID=A0A918A932_9ACTN|nr:hypothetical protein GCM10012278_58560 [Nonomuraea glycinis]
MVPDEGNRRTGKTGWRTGHHPVGNRSPLSAGAAEADRRDLAGDVDQPWHIYLVGASEGSPDAVGDAEGVAEGVAEAVATGTGLAHAS